MKSDAGDSMARAAENGASAAPENSEETKNFVVPEGIDRERADKILAGAFPDFSRSRLQKIIDSGRVSFAQTGELITRKTPLSGGDELAIKFPQATIPALIPAEIPLDIVFEDDDIVVVNKEPGIVTHPGAGTGGDTLVHALLHHTHGKLAAAGGENRPGVVHRLDKETSGLILFAKTDAAYYALVEKFRDREMNKEYIALVDKAPDLLAGTVDEPIERHPTNRLKMSVRENGKPARTDWFVEEKFGTDAALVRCILHTGRTHQIRVHMAFIGHPILGDRTYGKVVARHAGWPLPRVMLHAARLCLDHPITGAPLEFSALPPPDFANLATYLRERFGSRLYSHRR
ncbi:MAG: RluA family pseudouridine synthase [Opitutae bacterium]|nr:RluA family pseudouridine synthase [Opitutae bacterium]